LAIVGPGCPRPIDEPNTNRKMPRKTVIDIRFTRHDAHVENTTARPKKVGAWYRQVGSPRYRSLPVESSVSSRPSSEIDIHHSSICGRIGTSGSRAAIRRSDRRNYRIAENEFSSPQLSHYAARPVTVGGNATCRAGNHSCACGATGQHTLVVRDFVPRALPNNANFGQEKARTASTCFWP
jgi:hypothetical protein